MRTTVTLDPDVIRMLKDDAHRRGSSFKIALNNAVRRAFQAPKAKNTKKPFLVKARDMGLRPGIDPTRLAEIADEMETDAFLEVTRRLEKESNDPPRR